MVQSFEHSVVQISLGDGGQKSNDIPQANGLHVKQEQVLPVT
ncbi:MAG: hypothetical protein AAF617_14220 [Bacteroidota bacterium]